MRDIKLSFELKELNARIKLCFNRVLRKVLEFGYYLIPGSIIVAEEMHHSIDLLIAKCWKMLPVIESHFNSDSQTYLYFPYL